MSRKPSKGGNDEKAAQGANTGRGNQGDNSARNDPESAYEKFAADIKEEIARNQLRSNLCKKRKDLLEKSVERFKSEGGSAEDAEDLNAQAEAELAYLQLRDELYSAMNDRDLDRLLDVCKRIEEADDRRYKNPLTADMMMARKLICMLNRNVDLPERLDFDDRSMRELAQFSNPPQVIHEVVIAALLLLGEYEGYSRNWVFCRDLLRPYKSSGKGGLRLRVETFDPALVNEELAGRAKEIIDKYQITDIFRVSESAAGLYVWTRSKLQEVKVGQPADLKRQREILTVEMPSKKWKPQKHF